MNPRKPKVEDFFKFIYERQRIWYKKEVLRQPAPWTNDKILSQFSFCNVYRELDKCTIHLIENVHKNKSLSLESKIFNIILYRRFNTSTFFNEFGVWPWKNFDYKLLIHVMDKTKNQGKNLFNSAYIVTQHAFDKKARKDKHVQQIIGLASSASRIDELTESLLGCNYVTAFMLLRQIYGHGPFLAQQVLIDISYLKEFKHWDTDSFVTVGPGARPGIDLLYPFGIKKPVFYPNICKELWSKQAEQFAALQIKYDMRWDIVRYKSPIDGKKWIRLSDIQNCLCEFRKYCHLQTNPNKRKRYYHGFKRTQD